MGDIADSQTLKSYILSTLFFFVFRSPHTQGWLEPWSIASLTGEVWENNKGQKRCAFFFLSTKPLAHYLIGQNLVMWP